MHSRLQGIMQSILALFVAFLAVGVSSAVLHQSSPDTSMTAQLDGKLPSTIPSNFYFSGNVRTYYIQAEQVTWEYVPTGWDNVRILA